jgi:ABC-type uncharacterized transport system involved in gliding motility auxiliary subunit
MLANRASRFRLRLASSGFVVLLLVAVGLGLWLTRSYHVQFDWTRASRNTLSEASRNLLTALSQPVRITAYATEQGGLRKTISALVGRYQQYKSDIALDFVDPTLDPAKARAANVRIDGELVVEVNGRKENLNQLTEDALTNALQRLGRGGERWVVFVTGHGERSPDRPANHDLSTWAQQLGKRGLKTRAIALGKTAIPENTSVLVIAGPRVKLLPAEVKQVEQYLARGGNLLWLLDPGPLQGLERVAESLGLELQRGVIVDPASQLATGSSPTFIVGNPERYGAHPVVQGFALTTVFPEAAGLAVQAPKGWEQQTVLDTEPVAWSETGPLNNRVQFNAGDDLRGPLNLAVALTRKQDNREQRVLMVGDGDFLANAYIGNGGNLDLGMNMVNWLGADDAYINVPVRTASDLSLNFSQPAQIVIGLAFPLLLPLGLFATGMTIWWRRRKR